MALTPVPVVLVFPNPPTTIEATIAPMPNDLWRIEPVSPEGGNALLLAVRENLGAAEPE